MERGGWSRRRGGVTKAGMRWVMKAGRSVSAGWSAEGGKGSTGPSEGWRDLFGNVLSGGTGLVGWFKGAEGRLGKGISGLAGSKPDGVWWGMASWTTGDVSYVGQEEERLEGCEKLSFWRALSRYF